MATDMFGESKHATTHREHKAFPDVSTVFSAEARCVTEKEFFDIVKVIDVPLIELATLTLWYTGMRIPELFHLNVEDVDLSNIRLRVPSGRKFGRTIPIHPKLLPLLQKYRAEHRSTADTAERLFVLKGGKTLSPGQYNRFLQRAVMGLGLNKRVTPPMFRYIFAATLIKKGVDPVTIRTLIGWKVPLGDTDGVANEWETVSNAIKLL